MESTVYRRDQNGNLVPVVISDEQPAKQVVQDPQTYAPAKAPAQPKVKKSKRRILPRRITRPLKIFLILYLVVFAWVISDLSGSLQKTSAMPSNQIADTNGTNWLLVGSDSRDGMTRKQQLDLHTGG